MATIPLSQGLVAIVDDADFEWLNRHKWHAAESKGRVYAARTVRINGKKNTILMHRELLDCPAGTRPDHINTNSLDNRRENLRPATRHQNMANQKFSAANTSGFRGVCFDKSHSRWQACIYYKGHKRTLGRFASAIDAALAYDEAARSLFGEFARPNFIDGELRTA